MSNYIPYYGKKKDILANREEDLIRAIKRGDSQEKIARAAEKVRAAKLREIAARRARVLAPEGDPRLSPFDAEISRVIAMSLGQIIAESQKRATRQKQG